MSRDKSVTSWAALRAANSASSCTTPASNFPDVATSGYHQRPLWKPRGKAVSKSVPALDAFPALAAEGTAVGQGPSAPGDRVSPTAPASVGQQANTHPRIHPPEQQRQHQQQQQTGFAAQTDRLMRRRSLSAPSLADAVQQTTRHGHLYSTVASSRSANNSRSSSVDRSRHNHTEHQQHQQLQRQQLQQQHADVQQHGAATGLQLLQECHPWCDAVLLHEVMEAFNGDVPAALESLQQMVAVDSAQCRPGSSCSEASCSDDNSSSSSASERAARSTAAQGTLLVQNWPAGPDDDQGLQETQQLQQLQQLQLGDLKTREYSVRGQQPQHSNQQHQQQQQERQQQQQLGQQQHEVGVRDTYHALRGDAVKLSHKYRKASKRAAAARARGDVSAAARLAAEAVSLKAAADAADAAAALKIEVANNADNPDGLWELDLHGLHVNEALAALQERVQLLQEIAQDLRKQMSAQQQLQHEPRSQVHKHAPCGTGTLQGLVAATNGASSTKQAVLTSLLLPTDSVLSWEQQLSAMHQELRVIVGKGLHSSGGEASLPRVVEQWLLQHGYRYVWRGGCIGVNLKLL